MSEQTIAIVGLGYVGLPLAVEFAKQYRTIGFDINEKRVNELKKGFDRTKEVCPEDLQAAASLEFHSEEGPLDEANIYIITVPTPVDEFKKPDLSPLSNASKMVGRMLSKGDIVVYESTVYPGCTEEVCVPILENESGLTYNQDFFCG